MNTRKVSMLLASIAVATAMFACDALATKPTVSNIRMTTDEQGKTTTTSYSPSDKFYVFADLSGLSNGSVVEAKWYAVNADGVDPNSETDGLGSSIGMKLAMAAGGGDKSPRRVGRFNHLHKRPWFQCREVFSGLANVHVGNGLRDRSHARIIFARSVIVIRHLTDQVFRGHPGQIGRFRMTLPGHQMAGAASHRDAGTTFDGGRRRPMFFRKPIRRIRIAGNFGSIVFPRAAIGSNDPIRPRSGRLDFVGYVEGPVGKAGGHAESLSDECLRKDATQQACARQPD